MVLDEENCNIALTFVDHTNLTLLQLWHITVKPYQSVDQRLNILFSVSSRSDGNIPRFLPVLQYTETVFLPCGSDELITSVTG